MVNIWLIYIKIRIPLRHIKTTSQVRKKSPVELFGALFGQGGLLLPQHSEACGLQLGLNGHLRHIPWVGPLRLGHFMTGAIWGHGFFYTKSNQNNQIDT